MTSFNPVTKDITYTKNVYQYSEQYMYVGVGPCFKGWNNVAETKKKKRKRGYLTKVVYINNRVVWTFLRSFCLKTDNFLLLFLILIYVCNELSISISLSRFSVFNVYQKALPLLCILV